MTKELELLVERWRSESKELPLISMKGAMLDKCADQLEAALREAAAQLGRVGEPVGYVHPDTIKGLQAGLCTKSYLFAKPMPQVWADVPLYTTPQLPVGVPDAVDTRLRPLLSQWREQADEERASGGKSAIQFAEGLRYCATDLEFALAGIIEDSRGTTPQSDSAALIGQQQAPEGDGGVLCRECGNVTMHIGNLCFSCTKSATEYLTHNSAAPDGDVEQRARELLAAEYEKASGTVKLSELVRKGRSPTDTIAIRAIIAALSTPKQVGVAPDGSDGLRARLEELASAWVADENCTASQIECRDELIDVLKTTPVTSPQAAPVPVEGGFDRDSIFREANLRAAAYNLMLLIEGPGCIRWEDGNGFRLKDTNEWCQFYVAVKNIQRFASAPPSQPAVELDGWISDPDSIPKKIINACRDAILIEFGNNGTDGYYKRILARVFVALLEGAKAGKGESK